MPNANGCNWYKYMSFFVWTPHGHYHEKIEFNFKFLKDIVPKFEKFYEEYLKYHWSLKR